MQGEGVLRYETGDVYEGYMVNGMRSGHGILTYASGDSYDGYWLLDQRHGGGKKIDLWGHVLESGVYDSDNFVG